MSTGRRLQLTTTAFTTAKVAEDGETQKVKARILQKDEPLRWSKNDLAFRRYFQYTCSVVEQDRCVPLVSDELTTLGLNKSSAFNSYS